MMPLSVEKEDGAALYVSKNEIASDTVSAGILGHTEGLTLFSASKFL